MYVRSVPTGNLRKGRFTNHKINDTARVMGSCPIQRIFKDEHMNLLKMDLITEGQHENPTKRHQQKGSANLNSNPVKLFSQFPIKDEWYPSQFRCAALQSLHHDIGNYRDHVR